MIRQITLRELPRNIFAVEVISVGASGVNRIKSSTETMICQIIRFFKYRSELRTRLNKINRKLMVWLAYLNQFKLRGKPGTLSPMKLAIAVNDMMVIDNPRINRR